MRTDRAIDPTSADWALVTLANDAVLDWAVALVASLRRFAPEHRVHVIPYDDRMDGLAAALAQLGNAEIWRPPELAEWDELGRELYPEDAAAARGFRKLAAFGFPCRRFLFVDADAVALAPLAELEAAVDAAAPDLVHFDTDVEQVYRPGPVREALSRAGRGVGFNCGLFSGRGGTLDARGVRRAVESLPGPWRDHLVPLAEQAFLNLAADRARLRVAGASELLSGVCSTCWPAVGRIEEDADGAFRLRGSGRWDEGWRFLFAHWAGFQLSEGMPNFSIWSRFREAARV